MWLEKQQTYKVIPKHTLPVNTFGSLGLAWGPTKFPVRTPHTHRYIFSTSACTTLCRQFVQKHVWLRVLTQ